MKVKEILRLLVDDGWYLVRTKGSHQQYKHKTKKGTVTVPCHRLSDDLGINTVKSIFRQANIKED